MNGGSLRKSSSKRRDYKKDLLKSKAKNNKERPIRRPSPTTIPSRTCKGNSPSRSKLPKKVVTSTGRKFWKKKSLVFKGSSSMSRTLTKTNKLRLLQKDCGRTSVMITIRKSATRPCLEPKEILRHSKELDLESGSTLSLSSSFSLFLELLEQRVSHFLLEAYSQE